MEIRWKLHCQVVVTHVLTLPLEVEENEELKNLLKCGKFSFYVIADREIFTYLKNKKQLILEANKKFKMFDFLNETVHDVLVNGVIWSNPLIFLTHQLFGFNPFGVKVPLTEKPGFAQAETENCPRVKSQ